MDVTEILQFADRLVFANKGKHLDDLQKTVIAGVYEGKTYETIAEECYRSESRVRSVGRKLWEIFSEELGEDIKKSNFIYTIERLQIKSSPAAQSAQVVGVNNHHFHFCTQTFNQSNESESKNTNKSTKAPHYDLTQSPKVIKFYNRESEIQKLDRWIFHQNIPLISILGLLGFGKTTLVKKFADINLDKFSAIIWKTLKHPEALDLLIDDLIKFFYQEINLHKNNKVEQLFDILAKKKCLIIFDDVQNLFLPGELSGQYKPEYQDYQNFFKRIAETEHQSHLILISEEQCAEMECLDEELYPIRCLELSGLYDINILKDMGLKDDNSWLNLINLYEGNFFYIKTIANSIKNVFEGYVGEFLAENELVIPKDIQTNLQLLFDRLSPLEQKIAIELSNSEQILSRQELKTSLDLSSTDLINSLESLQKRYLVKKIKGDKIMFKLDSVFREYVKNCGKNSC